MKRSSSTRLGDESVSSSVTPLLDTVYEPNWNTISEDIWLCVLLTSGFKHSRSLCAIFFTCKQLYGFGLRLIEEKRSLKQSALEYCLLQSDLYYPYVCNGGLFHHHPTHNSDVDDLPFKMEEMVTEMIRTSFVKKMNLLKGIAVSLDNVIHTPYESEHPLPVYSSKLEATLHRGIYPVGTTYRNVTYPIGYESVIVGDIIRAYFLFAFLRFMLATGTYAKLLDELELQLGYTTKNWKNYTECQLEELPCFWREVKIVKKLRKKMRIIGEIDPEYHLLRRVEQTNEQKTRAPYLWNITCLASDRMYISPTDVPKLHSHKYRKVEDIHTYPDIFLSVWYDYVRKSSDDPLGTWNKVEFTTIRSCHQDEFKSVIPAHKVVQMKTTNGLTRPRSCVTPYTNVDFYITNETTNVCEINKCNNFIIKEKILITKMDKWPAWSNSKVPLYTRIPMVKANCSDETKRLNVITWEWMGVHKTTHRRTEGITYLVKYPRKFLDTLVDDMATKSAKRLAGMDLFRAFYDGIHFRWSEKANSMTSNILGQLLDLFPVDTFFCSKQNWLKLLPEKILRYVTAWNMSMGPDEYSLD